MIARVRDLALREPIRIQADATLREAASAMHVQRAVCALIEDGTESCIITDSNLRDALALDGISPDGPVARVARRPPVTIDAGAIVLDALIQMQRRGVERLLVTDQGRISAILEQADVLGHLAIHSNAILRIAAQAHQSTDLAPAADAMVRMVGALLRNGVKPDRIGRLASDVNRAIFRRLFELLMPKDLQQDVCFVVMGSEGRREQILPTDQDNALIVRDGLDADSVMPACCAITSALIDLGYPRCPGDIMISNPAWVLTQTQFRAQVSQWIASSGNDEVMNLAIFFDAEAVAGDEHLLDGVKAVLFETTVSSDAFYAQFASAINAFRVPVGVFSRLQIERSGDQAGTLDIKKGGVFPIVHGIRALALQKKLTVTPTLDRIEALVGMRVIDQRFAREVAAAFSFLCTVRAESGLASIESGGSATNRIRPDELTQIDQRALAESLRVVVKLRRLVGQNFRLDLLGF
ncbi:MAG: CBS domain-containing protein [Sterolibacteriaceae bacterium]|nr:CBS domain-containing protein [Sterolibacteriaceae bacterium]MBK9083845.1 CBS domain-containing protein [Sterolibacteriaceae bacterium]